MKEQTNNPSLPPLPSPGEIVTYLDRFVFGQGKAKRNLASAVYNHYLGLAIRDRDKTGPHPFGPQNLLLLGGTGTGKTYMVKSLARFLGVPFFQASATSLVQTGYVGVQVEEMVRGLARSNSNDISKAERGIIFIDEFDKIRRQTRADGGPDVSGEGVQAGLLNLIEGIQVPLTLPGKQGPAGSVDSSRIFFVFAGAFVGLEDIIARRLDKNTQKLGFVPRERIAQETAEGSPLQDLAVEDLVEFGMIPELIGRLTAHAALEAFKVEDLVKILKGENSILQRKTAFWEAHGIDLEFTEGALRLIAKQAIEMKTGARALNHFVERALVEVACRPLELVAQKVRRIIVDESTVRGDTPPALEGTVSRKKVIQALDSLRQEAFHPIPCTGSNIVFTNVDGWPPEKIRERIEAVKRESLEWEETNGSARKWWLAFEKENKNRLPLVLKLVEELAKREATINEFFLAYVYSNTDNIQANLHYLDYTRLKRQEQKSKRIENIKEKMGRKETKHGQQEDGSKGGEGKPS